MQKHEPLSERPLARRHVALLVFLLSVGPALRAVLAVEKDLALSWHDLGGLLADLAMGGVVALALWLALRLGRPVAWLLTVAWVVLNFAYYEFVSVFDSIDAMAHTHYLADPTFFQGSVATVTHPWLAALGLGLGTALVWWPRPQAEPRAPGRRALGALGVATAIALCLTAAWQVQEESASWRQRNFVFANLFSPGAQLKALDMDQPLDPENQALFKPDLAGERRAPLAQGQKPPNVLLVLVEGISGAYLPSVAAHHGVDSPVKMKHLDEIAQQGVMFDTFLVQQRQTNRGEYSVLCGDYPKLATRAARMSEYVQGGQRRCLPEILRQEGYHTAYLQAAPLAFMFKDQFMGRIGFEQVLGDTYFDGGYARNRWGVDDKAFFEQSLQLIGELQAQDKPWFLTLLTVGTHHPFPVPDDFRPQGASSDHDRALLWLDEALRAFMEALRRQGVTEDTLIVFTSDESAGLTHGVGDTMRSLSQTWGYLAMLHPSGHKERVQEPFALSDLGLTLLDGVGLAERAPHFVGRSAWRRYDAPRALVFSNTYTHKTGSLEPGGRLTLCQEDLSLCRSVKVDPLRAFAPSTQELDTPPQTSRRLQQVVARSLAVTEPLAAQAERSLQLTTDPQVALHQQENSQLIFAGQYISIPRQSLVSVDLELEIEGQDSLVELSHDLISQGHRHHKPSLPSLRSGDKVEISYTVPLKEGAERLECRLFALALQGKNPALKIKRATLRIGPLEDPGAKKSARLEVSAAAPDAPLRVQARGFKRKGCVKPDGDGLQALRCDRQHLLFGPHLRASKGSQVQVQFEVEALRGDTRLVADVVSRLGRHKHKSTDPVLLKPGQRETLTLELRLDRPVKDLEARLLSEPQGTQQASLRIHRAQLLVTPPTQP